MERPVKKIFAGDKVEARKHYGLSKLSLFLAKEIRNLLDIPFYSKEYKRGDGSISVSTMKHGIDRIIIKQEPDLRRDEEALIDRDFIFGTPFTVTLDLYGTGWMFFRSGDEKRHESFCVDLWGGGGGALSEYYADTINNYLRLFAVAESNPFVGIILYMTSDGWKVLTFAVKGPKPNYAPMEWTDVAYGDGEPEKTKEYTVYDFEFKIEGPFKREIKKSDPGSLGLPLIVPSKTVPEARGYYMPDNTAYGFVFPQTCYCWVEPLDPENPKTKLERVRWEIWAEFSIEVRYEIFVDPSWHESNYFYPMGVFIRDGGTEWEGINNEPINIYDIDDIILSGWFYFGLRPKVSFQGEFYYGLKGGGGPHSYFKSPENLVGSWPIFNIKKIDTFLHYRLIYFDPYEDVFWNTYCLYSVQTGKRFFVRDNMRAGIGLEIEGWYS